MPVLKRALPTTDSELIGGMCAHLFDLWETGQTLNKKLEEVSGFRFPRDRERLRDTLLWIEAIQLDMAIFWVGEVKKVLPKLLRALNQQGRGAKSTAPGRVKNNRKGGRATV
jgi:hypothetical protein